MQFVSVSLLNFSNKMEDYLNDAEEISSAIANRQYKYKTCTTLVNDYNDWHRRHQNASDF